MRVVIVSPYSWSTPGGVNTHIEGLAGALRRRGSQVKVVAPCDGIAPRGLVAVGRSVPVPFNGSVARLAFGPRVAARVRRTLRQFDPDIVHVHEPFAPSVSMLATLASRAPVVATFHSDAPDSRTYRAARPALRPLWRRLAARIAVSEAAAATVARVFGERPEIVPNGVTVARYAGVPAADPRSKCVVFLGRLEPRKGAQILVEAAPAVLAAHPGARIVIAGRGPQARALEAAIPSGAKDAVELAGAVAQEEVTRLAARASVFCFPSLGGESFGVVLLEAMAAGRAVVASDIPGYAAVLRDGVEGLLVPAGDAAAVAAALVRLLGDPAEAAAMAERGRARAAEFDWDTLGGRVEEIYRRAIASRRG